jgi:hypothetical protein
VKSYIDLHTCMDYIHTYAQFYNNMQLVVSSEADISYIFVLPRGEIEGPWCKTSNFATTGIHFFRPTTSPPPSLLIHDVTGQRLEESSRKLPGLPVEYQAASGGHPTVICIRV